MKKNQLLTDEVLIKRYVRGDESCFEVLLNRYKSRVFGYILMLVRRRDVAEDIFQETFIKIVRQLKAGEYTDEGKFAAWAIRIAHHVFIDKYRVDRKIQTISHVKEKGTDEYVDIFSVLQVRSNAVSSDSMEKEEQRQTIKNLLELLPDKQKEVVYMRIYLGLSFKEIADSLDSNLNTVLGRMNYATIKLGQIIKEKGLFRERYAGQE